MNNSDLLGGAIKARDAIENKLSIILMDNFAGHVNLKRIDPNTRLDTLVVDVPLSTEDARQFAKDLQHYCDLNVLEIHRHNDGICEFEVDTDGVTDETRDLVPPVKAIA